MRVNVYAEEMTDRVEIISKDIDGHRFTGLRFYLELPATVNGVQYQGLFMHRPGDDDSSAVTFWGKRDLREVLRKALALLDTHYEELRDSKMLESEGGAQVTFSVPIKHVVHRTPGLDCLRRDPTPSACKCGRSDPKYSRWVCNNCGGSL
jgi:hypothetical protein